MLAVPAGADTIILKNGRKILADTVRENGTKVEYTVGEDTYAISKSSVERIDTGGSPIVTRAEAAPAVNHVIFCCFSRDSATLHEEALAGL